MKQRRRKTRTHYIRQEANLETSKENSQPESNSEAQTHVVSLLSPTHGPKYVMFRSLALTRKTRSMEATGKRVGKERTRGREYLCGEEVGGWNGSSDYAQLKAQPISTTA